MIDLKLATESWDEKEYQAIERVVKSGRFSMGKEVQEFEKQFAKYFGSKYAVANFKSIILSSPLYNNLNKY